MKGENYAVVSRGDDGGSCSKGESPGGHPLYERRRFAWDPLRNPQNQTPALGKEMSNHRRAGRTAPRPLAVPRLLAATRRPRCAARAAPMPASCTSPVASPS